MVMLSQIRTGDTVEVVEIPKHCPLGRVLQQFGIIPGSVLFCRYCSPGEELAALEFESGVLAMQLRELSEITVQYCQ